MAVVSVSMYVVSHEKRTQFQALVKKFLKFKKANPKIFEGVKFRLFEQEYGGIVGSYVEMWEFKGKEEMEKFNATMMKHKEMKEIEPEFYKMIDQNTLTSSIWNTVV